jgi:hypothetical protein
MSEGSSAAVICVPKERQVALPVGEQSLLREISMKLRILIPAAAVAATALCGAASAQSVGVYVGPAYDDYYYYEGPPSYPRAARRYEDRGVVYGYRGGCGTYRFWNGEECVDARWR